MRIVAIKTRPLAPPQDDLNAVLESSLPEIKEKSVVVVTSKVVAISQGRCIPVKGEETEKDTLAMMEADWYSPRTSVPGGHLLFTRKENMLIASAGVDKSNAKGFMVMWPENLKKTVREIHGFIKKIRGVKELGVIISDSRVTMMRRGTIGMAISHFGFNPVKNYVGTEDIFGRKLEFQSSNMADGMAVAAVLVMGEGKEQTPLAILTEVPGLEFSEDETINLGTPPLTIPFDEDMFLGMLTGIPWIKGGGGKYNKN